MSRFLLLTKISLLRFFDIKKVTNSKYKTERKKNIAKVILLLFIILYLSYYIYKITNLFLPGFISINMPNYILGLMFVITTIFILIHNIFKVKSSLFDFNDYDLLNSMPIKRSIIILSKIVSVYLLNLLYTFIIMVPSYIAYIKYTHDSFSLLYFILLFIIPVVPLLVSYILGIILSWLTSRFKNTNLAGFIINISIIVIVMVLSFKINSLDATALANNGMSLINRIDGFYPLTNVFMRLLNNFSFIDLLYFIMVPFILTLVFIYIINHFYIQIRTNLLKTNVKSDYKLKTYHVNSSLVSLYKKEMRKITSNPLYILNTVFGCILLIILVFCILIFNNNTLSNYLNIPDFSSFLRNHSIFIVAICCALSSTTYPSISLEGKSLWIMKMLPVSSDQIFLSKILVNLTFLVPTIIICGTFFGIYLHFSLIEFILIYLMPFMYALFISSIGLIYNLLFPKFDYDNEIRVIKQSFPSFLTIFTGMIASIIPMMISEINSGYMIIVTNIVLLVDIVLFLILHFYGRKRFREL